MPHPPSKAQARAWALPRALPLSLAAALVGLAAWYAPRQPLRADPLHEPNGWEWFWTPSETNAWLRVGRATGLGQLSPERGPLADDLAVHGQTVLVAYRGGIVLRTDDGGKTWTPSAVPLAKPGAVTSVALVSPAEALAATGGAQLWTLREGAEVWTPEPLPGATQLQAVGAAGGVAWALEPDQVWLRTADRWTSYPLAARKTPSAAAPRRVPPLRPLAVGTEPPAKNVKATKDRPDRPYQKATVSQGAAEGSMAGEAALSKPDQPGPPPFNPMSIRELAAGAGLYEPPPPRARLVLSPDGSSARVLTERGLFRVGRDGKVEVLPRSALLDDLPDSGRGGLAADWPMGQGSSSLSFGADEPEVEDQKKEAEGEQAVTASAPGGLPALAWTPEGLARRDFSGWRRPEPVRVAFDQAELTHLSIDAWGMAWAVTRNGEVCSSEDAGKTWQLRFAARQTFIAAHVEHDDEKVVAALSPRWLLVSEDHGETFRSVPGRGTLPSNRSPDGSEARWVPDPPAPGGHSLQYVGPAGQVLASVRADGKVVLFEPREDVIDTGGPQPILDLYRSANGSWWAAGRDGLVLTSERQLQPRTWNRVELGVKDADFRLIRTCEHGDRAFVFGEAGMIHFRDATGSWRSPRHAVSPAPWSFVAWVLAMGLAFVGARPRPAEAAAHQDKVADLLVADTPIAHPRDDVLGLHALALTLSHFIRNKRTVPPVTLAVTGPWGSGKSSVLNLLTRDLKVRGMKPVLFNAWHHQQESDVLAALYARIIRDGVPGFLSLAGMEFRLRLLFRRARQRAVFLGVLVLLVGFAIGFFSQTDHPLHVATLQVERFFGLLRQLKAMVMGDPIPTLPSDAASHDHGGELTVSAALLSALGGAAGLLAALRRGLLAFGAGPATLLASLRRTLRLGSEEQRERVSFQTQFADDFRDVTEALGDRKMVLLIDDLDRCSGENLMRVLQAVSFLTSSGRCFVVMATSRTILQEAVAQQADHVVLEPEEEEGLAERDPELRQGQRRQLHARRYLEKLINIEVAVPRMSEAGTRRLTRDSAPHGEEVEQTRLQWLWAHVSRTQVVVALGALAVAAYFAGQEVGPRAAAPAVPVAAPAATAVLELEAPPGQEPAPGAPGAAAAPADGRPPAAAAPERQDPPLGEVRVVKSPGRERSRWPVAAALVLAALALGHGLRHFRRVAEKDSRQFLEALEIWLPVIRLQNLTPRSIKRFLNRLRFIAMQRRAEAYAAQWRDPQAELERAVREGRWWAAARLAWDRVRDAPEQIPEGMVPEATLVAVSALEEAVPEVEGNLAALAALRGKSPVIAEAWEKHEACLRLPVLPQDEAQMRQMRGGARFGA